MSYGCDNTDNQIKKNQHTKLYIWSKGGMRGIYMYTSGLNNIAERLYKIKYSSGVWE